MNSRSSVNESNLVNLSANLSSLDALDTKDSLSLSFPFDHIYACHSEGSDSRQTLSLDKDVEISTHCVVSEPKEPLGSSSSDINRLSERLTAAENQNKKLKDLLVYHLDLIQQQNDVITKREKLYQALKLENDTLKSKVTRMDKKSSKQAVTLPAPVVHVPPPVATSTIVKPQAGPSNPVLYNSFQDLLLADNNDDPYIFDEGPKAKPFNDVLGKNVFDPNKLTKENELGVPRILTDLDHGSILEDKPPCENLTMIENKRSSYIKKDPVKTERPEPLYTVTTTSGNPVIQKIQRSRRRTTSSIGSLSRMPKTAPVKVEPPDTGLNLYDDDKTFERFSVNKKSKMINTYGKSKSSTISKRTAHYTGSLSDRLQLIDTTPTGEDPYQLGEADMREQSPIPKLMLQKTNHGRMKICTENTGRIYDAPATETSSKLTTKIKLESRYNLPSTVTHSQMKKDHESETSKLPAIDIKTPMVFEPDMALVKTESEIDWRVTPPTSLSEYPYADVAQAMSLSSSEMARYIDSQTTEEAKSAAEAFQNMDLKTIDMCARVSEKADINEKPEVCEKPSKKRGPRTTSFMTPEFLSPATNDIEHGVPRGTGSNRGRKRALSTTGLKGGKQLKPPAPPKPRAPRGKGGCRGKKMPVPGMTTIMPYHTLVGDPDVSWYYGLDPDVKLEDIYQPGASTVSTVEVPRWREKPYTSCYTMEGTENLDDKVFEKRHQKLEAEERRQLRWHMRRIREQRHVERLRQRQRDSWCSGLNSPAYQPSLYTIWQQPLRDVHFIEITDTLPVMAFGEEVPALPNLDFMLPWVRMSKALKRAKRSKTLH